MDTSALEFSKQMKNSNQLRKLEFKDVKIDKQVSGQLFRDLCKCTSLQEVDIAGWEATSLATAIKLNRVGRAYIRERPNDSLQASEVLGAVTESLDCLYFHLRENPGIVTSWRQ